MSAPQKPKIVQSEISVDQSPGEETDVLNSGDEFSHLPVEKSGAGKKKVDKMASTGKDQVVHNDDDSGELMDLSAVLEAGRSMLVLSGGSNKAEDNRFLQALANPMAAHDSEFEKEFEDLIDTPGVVSQSAAMPPGSPPPYTSDNEGEKSASKSLDTLSQPHELNLQDDEHSRRYPFDSTESSEEIDYEDYTTDQIEVLSYIDQFHPKQIDFVPKLQAFQVEYQPAMGEPDLFMKVPRPDEIDDNAGLSHWDEPPPSQTDAALVEMQIKNAAKDSTVLDGSVPVKVLFDADKNGDQILDWIKHVKEVRKDKPATAVHFNSPMPNIEELMQETPPQLQHIKAIPAELDVSLEQYVDLSLNLLGIPAGPGKRVPGVHQLFGTLNAFQKSAYFRNHATRQQNEKDINNGVERLEL